MRIIGLTGGIACGKSTVSAHLRQKGAYIIDGDAVAKKLSEPYRPIWKAYVEHFGKQILNGDNTLNRRLIGQIVFSDEQEKVWMNSTMHPLIKEEILLELNQCKQNKIEVVILDIPLLYEAGWDKLADEVWVVQISRQLQIKRIQERDNLTEQEAINRIEAQMLVEEKAKLADVVIDSSNPPAITLQLVDKIWNERLGKGLKINV